MEVISKVWAVRPVIGKSGSRVGGGQDTKRREVLGTQPAFLRLEGGGWKPWWKRGT